MNNYYFSSWITPRLYEISNNNYKLAHKKHMNSRTRKVTKILTKCLSKLWTRTSTNPIIPHGILTQVHPLFNLLQCNSHFSLIFFFSFYLFIYIFFYYYLMNWNCNGNLECWNKTYINLERANYNLRILIKMTRYNIKNYNKSTKKKTPAPLHLFLLNTPH